MNYRFLSLCVPLLSVVLASCTFPGETESVNVEIRDNVFNNGLPELPGIPIQKMSISPIDFQVIEKSEDYYTGIYLHTSATEVHFRTAEDMFIEGTEATEPASPFHHSYDNFFEVRRKSDGRNNFNRLKTSEYSSAYYLWDKDNLDYTYYGNLEGHPAYLHFALESMEDPGGGRKWVVSGLEDKNGQRITDTAEWSCVWDNEYYFLKGWRFVYDPNGPNNDGEICEKELQWVADPTTITQVGGRYDIFEEDGAAYIKFSYSFDFGQEFGGQAQGEIVSSSFDEIKMVIYEDSNIRTVAILKPIAAIDDLPLP